MDISCQVLTARDQVMWTYFCSLHSAWRTNYCLESCCGATQGYTRYNGGVLRSSDRCLVQGALVRVSEQRLIKQYAADVSTTSHSSHTRARGSEWGASKGEQGVESRVLVSGELASGEQGASEWGASERRVQRTDREGRTRVRSAHRPVTYLQIRLVQSGEALNQAYLVDLFEAVRAGGAPNLVKLQMVLQLLPERVAEQDVSLHAAVVSLHAAAHC